MLQVILISFLAVILLHFGAQNCLDLLDKRKTSSFFEFHVFLYENEHKLNDIIYKFLVLLKQNIFLSMSGNGLFIAQNWSWKQLKKVLEQCVGHTSVCISKLA